MRWRKRAEPAVRTAVASRSHSVVYVAVSRIGRLFAKRKALCSPSFFSLSSLAIRSLDAVFTLRLYVIGAPLSIVCELPRKQHHPVSSLKQHDNFIYQFQFNT